MDQTSVRLQNVYKKTLSPKGAKEVRVVQPPGDPESITVCHTISADGTKVPASIVFKSNARTGKLSSRILKKLVVPENVRIYSTNSRWWNASFDFHWIKETFDECCAGGCVIRDRTPAHCKVESHFLFEEMRIEQVLIPAGLTGTYRPLDVGANPPFKCYMRRSYHT
ncbi:hypothetical protein RvY_03371 [Ramazzottius varieornatus]|uniref:DDE-1 domain-containing protein n=1 Tax=Ramazzottius varieornatus TaxID=947166 RepID=A0A1D1UNM1_RAMVA|nr:hypothetical protein RvY_03371 [Ramazzottius varieornatus]